VAEGRRHLKVTVTQSGGFVPVVTTTVADTEALAPKDGRRLREKVKQADLSSRTLRPGEPAYAITIEDDDATKVTLSESDLTDAHRDLIDFVGSVEGHEERIGPLGR